MGDYYHYMNPMGGGGVNQDPASQDSSGHPSNHPAMPYQIGGGMPIGQAFMHPLYGLPAGFPNSDFMIATKPAKGRRKSAPGLDHVKHRRTRSGCYTCRSRRVKCDETHPICDRCRKGKRDCVYPEPSAPKGTSGKGGVKESSAPGSGGSPDSSNEEDDAETEDIKLNPIPDEEEPDDISEQSTLRGTASSSSTTPNYRHTGSRQGSETPSAEGTQSLSPAASVGTTSSFSTMPFSDPAIQAANTSPEWSRLTQDQRFYLKYHRENITNYSYCMPFDKDGFFSSLFINIAATEGNEALLNAVVGFAAYHYTVHQSKGDMQEFLKYYNRSVMLLLKALKKKERYSIATILTMLQLATIEEYLGDWVNLVGHQKAALELIMQLFTPHSIQQTSTTRAMFTWYVRFDVFSGMMGGFDTRLPRQWFEISVEYCQRQVAKTGDLGWKIEAAGESIRLVSVDMSLLYAKAGRGEISGEDFINEYHKMTGRIHHWKENLDPDLTDPAYMVTDFEGQRPLHEDDIVDPFAPGVLYRGPLFPMTILRAEWHSIIVMHKSQEPMALTQEPSEELKGYAYGICQIFETCELWPYTPKGCLIIIQACLAIATLFLPRDTRHHMWMRRKYAMIESMGYVFPLTMRARMAEIFREPECKDWWLPNGEDLTPTIRDIRAFADERNANPVSQETESLREMGAIFAKMNLGDDDANTPSSTSSYSAKGKVANR